MINMSYMILKALVILLWITNSSVSDDVISTGWTALWSNTVPSQKVKLYMRIHLTWFCFNMIRGRWHLKWPCTRTNHLWEEHWHHILSHPHAGHLHHYILYHLILQLQLICIWPWSLLGHYGWHVWVLVLCMVREFEFCWCFISSSKVLGLHRSLVDAPVK